MDSIIHSLQQLKLSENTDTAKATQTNITKTEIIQISLQLWHENQRLKNEIETLQSIISHQTYQPKIPKWIT